MSLSGSFLAVLGRFQDSVRLLTSETGLVEEGEVVAASAALKVDGRGAVVPKGEGSTSGVALDGRLSLGAVVVDSTAQLLGRLERLRVRDRRRERVFERVWVRALPVVLVREVLRERPEVSVGF